MKEERAQRIEEPDMPNQNVKKPTRDDLLKAAAAAAKMGETFLAAANQGVVDEDTSPARPAVMARGTRDFPKDQREQQQGAPTRSRTGTRERQQAPTAFEMFMRDLKRAIERGGNRLRVIDNEGFVKIESLHNGHKIYIAKTKTVVNRIESTIPPDVIIGAVEPTRNNGRIASLLPADPEIVADAIDFLVESDERISSPRRGGGDTNVDQQRNNRLS